MGPQKEGYLDVSLPRNLNLAVTIDIVNSIHSILLKDFSFYVNEIIVPLIKVSGDEYRGVYKGIIMKYMVDENPSLTRLKFQVSRTFSPQELDTNIPDTRQLTLAFHSIIIELAPRHIPMKEKGETGQLNGDR